jgi:hypothetical protein
MAGPSLNPILLNCGHQVCAQCLPGLDSSRCPTCGSPITDAEPSKADAAFLETPLAGPRPEEAGNRRKSGFDPRWGNAIARYIWTPVWTVVTFTVFLVIGAFTRSVSIALEVGIVIVFVLGGWKRGLAALIAWAIYFLVVSVYLIVAEPMGARR